jgi:hypothetical protein
VAYAIISIMANIPDHLQPFFWETDLDLISIEKNRNYIIERIMELGDNTAVCWLFSNISVAEIKDVLEKSRRISAKSQNFWRIILEG